MARAVLLAVALMVLATSPLRSETLVAATTIRGATPIGAGDVTVVPESVPGALSDPHEAIGMEARNQPLSRAPDPRGRSADAGRDRPATTS